MINLKQTSREMYHVLSICLSGQMVRHALEQDVGK